MRVEASVTIESSAETVWGLITDIKNSANIISAIEKVEVLEEPKSGLVGFKWKETRTMWGKQATEIMWITEAEDQVFYETRAESHGSIYTSGLRITYVNEIVELTQYFEGQAVSFGAKLMNALTGWMLKGSLQKTIQKDLEDIKHAAEKA